MTSQSGNGKLFRENEVRSTAVDIGQLTSVTSATLTDVLLFDHEIDQWTPAPGTCIEEFLKREERDLYAVEGPITDRNSCRPAIRQ